MSDSRDERFMRLALQEARAAMAADEIPIGAVIVCGDKVIAKGHNLTECLTDVTAHAEMLAIPAAADSLGGKFLSDCELFVTVEPCLMCAGAIAWSRVGRLVYGTPDAKRGYLSQVAKSPFHPKTKVESGILGDECQALMQEFFRSKR